jgi:integration host factor subunit alpha
MERAARGTSRMGIARSDLANAVYRAHGGLSRRESRAVVDVIFQRIRGALADGDPVLISGFGSFRVLTRRPRRGRNPRTGEPVPIAAARRAVFRPSRLVVSDLNQRRPEGGADA